MDPWMLKAGEPLVVGMGGDEQILGCLRSKWTIRWHRGGTEIHALRRRAAGTSRGASNGPVAEPTAMVVGSAKEYAARGLEAKSPWVRRPYRAVMITVLTDAPKTITAPYLSYSNISVKPVGPCVMDSSLRVDAPELPGDGVCGK